MNTEERLPDRVRAALADPDTWADPPKGLVDRVISEGREAEGRPTHSIWIAAALALVLVGVSLFQGPGEPPDDGLIVAMTGTPLAPGAAGTVQMREAPSGWYIRLDVRGLPPAPEDAYYQGWLWDEDEGVSIGTFHMRNGAEPVGLWSGVSPEGFPVVKVTLQDLGGGSAPSDRVMMEGRVTDPVR